MKRKKASGFYEILWAGCKPEDAGFLGMQKAGIQF